MRAKSLFYILAYFAIFSVQYYAQNFNYLGNWDVDGVPEYLVIPGDSIDNSLLNRIRNSLPESQGVPDHHPEYISGAAETNIKLVKEADVYVTFVFEGAGYKNVLGFYTFDAGDTPETIEEIRETMTVIFPNVSEHNSGGNLDPGDKVHIGRYPAGTEIGWFIAADGWKGSSVEKGNWLVFSDRGLNPEADTTLQQHNVLLNDVGFGQVILGFEDIRRDYGSCDQDFNDAVFYVTSNPVDAIDYGDIEEVDDPEEDEDVDLSLEKVIDNDSPVDGDNVTYTITVTNNGPDGTTGVEVTDQIPEGLVYKSYSASQGTYDDITGVWEVGTLPNGASAQLEITAEVTLSNISTSAFDLGAAVGYNIFALDEVSQPSADTEGKLAAGGDVYLSNYSVGDKLSPGNDDVLIAGGSLTFISGTVTGGNVVYGEGSNLPRNQVTIFDGTVRQDSVIDFEQARSYLLTLSASLAQYPVTGSIEYRNSGIFLNGSDPFLNVFEVSGNELSNTTNMHISVPNGAVVLVNIDSSGVRWNGDLDVYGTAISNVLYNYYEADVLYVNNIDIRGTILAPAACLEFASGVINGQAIVKSVYGAGQFNAGSAGETHFAGNIPKTENILNEARITATDVLDNNPDNDFAEATLQLAGYEDPLVTGNQNWEVSPNKGLNELIWVLEGDGSGNLYAGTWGGKIYISTDSGTEWTRINEGMNAAYIWDILIENGTVYAATERGVFSSSDNTNWNIAALENKDVRAIETDGNYAYAGIWGDGIYRTSTSNISWEKLDNFPANAAVQDIEISPSGNIYAGSFGNGVLKSADEGDTWTDTGLPYAHVWSLGIRSDGVIFAGTYGGGIYVTQENSGTWSYANGSIAATHIYDISVSDNDDVFISSWSSGVYVMEGLSSSRTSKPSSYDWGSLGLYSIGISAIYQNNGVLYAGSSEGYLYVNSQPLTNVSNEIADKVYNFELKQNYPNPFNPTTVVSFSVSEPGNYKLEIFNILGEHVRTLVNRKLAPGNYTETFNGAGLNSGIYLYRLTGANRNMVKKMILVK